MNSIYFDDSISFNPFYFANIKPFDLYESTQLNIWSGYFSSNIDNRMIQEFPNDSLKDMSTNPQDFVVIRDSFVNTTLISLENIKLKYWEERLRKSKIIESRENLVKLKNLLLLSNEEYWGEYHIIPVDEFLHKAQVHLTLDDSEKLVKSYNLKHYVNQNSIIFQQVTKKKSPYFHWQDLKRLLKPENISQSLPDNYLNESKRNFEIILYLIKNYRHYFRHYHKKDLQKYYDLLKKLI